MADEKPKRFFFDTDKSYSKKQIDALIAKHGPNIAIGGNVEDEQHEALMAHARARGAKTHNYYVGRGEPANGYNNDGKVQFQSDQDEIAKHTARMGITREQWDNGGWLDHIKGQLLASKMSGSMPYSYEIDSLNNGGPEEIARQLADMHKWQKENGITSKLSLKNIEHQHLGPIDAQIKSGGISKDLLAPYHVVEEYASADHKRIVGDWAKQIGGTLVQTKNTNKYKSPKDGFSLEDEPTAAAAPPQQGVTGVGQQSTLRTQKRAQFTPYDQPQQQAGIMRLGGPTPYAKPIEPMVPPVSQPEETVAQSVMPEKPKVSFLQYAGVPSRSPQLHNNTQGGVTGNLGGVHPDLQSKLTAITKGWGQPINVISGYRDPARNAAVGGARGSQHMQGNAVDIDTGSLSHGQRLQLISLASKNGVTGIGVYPNNLHFDIGPRRAWGSDYSSGSVPSWASEAINAHMQGRPVQSNAGPPVYSGTAPAPASRPQFTPLPTTGQNNQASSAASPPPPSTPPTGPEAERALNPASGLQDARFTPYDGSMGAGRQAERSTYSQASKPGAPSIPGGDQRQEMHPDVRAAFAQHLQGQSQYPQWTSNPNGIKWKNGDFTEMAMR